MVQAGREQRKLVTVLFADMVDFTVATQRFDPEDVREIMNRYFAVWRREIETEGGVVEKFIGDAVMAVFGLHRSMEDDPHRAVRTAMAMRRSLDELNAGLRAEYDMTVKMRVGIDTGEVVVSTLGERGGDEFVVVGETVNRAARFQAAAPPGGILLSPDACRHVRGSFGLQRLPRLDLKGFDEPVDGYLVVAQDSQGFWPEARGIEGITTRTVGRDVELGRLRELFDDVIDDRAWVVATVMGEAGIGKSRLLHDFELWLAELPDSVWVLKGRAATTTRDVPNGLLRSLFAERLAIRESDPPAVVREKWHALVALLGDDPNGEEDAEVLGTWLGFPVATTPEGASSGRDPEATRRRANRVVADLFTTLANDAPIVVLFEDLHWADDASLDWLHEIGTTSTVGFPLLVVATARPALLDTRQLWGEGLDGHHLIRLERLSRREARQLIADIFQRAAILPDQLRDDVVDAAEGNPYFIEELIKWLIDEEVVATDLQGWTVFEERLVTLELPTTLRGVLQARLDSLDGDHRRVLERASVVGRVFWDGAVTRLGRDIPTDRQPDDPATSDSGRDDDPFGVADDVAAGLDQLRAHELIFGRPTSQYEGSREFSFRHALMRDVTHSSLLRSQRRRYHALAAEWLKEVVSQTHREAEHAAAIAAHLEEAHLSADAAHWYLQAGRHAAGAFANDSALQLLESGYRLAADSDDNLRFDLLLAREGVLNRLGRRDEQREVLDTLVGVVGVDAARRAEARIAQARWSFYHSDYEATEPTAREGARLAREAQRADLELDALLLVGRSMAFRNDHETARVHLEEVLDRARKAGSLRHVAQGLQALGVVWTNLGRHDQGLALLAEAGDVFAEIAHREGEGLVKGQMGVIFSNRQRYEEARQAGTEALAIFRAAGHQLRQAIVTGNLAQIAVESGHLDEGIALVRQAHDLAVAVDDQEMHASAHHMTGEHARLTGDVTGARQHLTQALDIARELDLQYYLAVILNALVMVELADGDDDAARTLANGALEAARQADMPQFEAQARSVAGIVSLRDGDATAIGLFEEAIELYDGLGRRPDLLECKASLAVALLDTDRTQAADLVTDVLSALGRGVVPGTLQPGQPILDCHHVLATIGDARVTETIRFARRFLDDRAARIADPDLRDRWRSTRVNVELAALAGAG